jgi:hypothetical protein
LTLKILSTHLASVCQFGAFVSTLVYHQVIWFGEASLTKFAHKFTLWSHLTTKIRPTVVIINSHYRKHFGFLNFQFFFFVFLIQSSTFALVDERWENVFVCVFGYFSRKCLVVIISFIIIVVVCSYTQINVPKCVLNCELICGSSLLPLLLTIDDFSSFTYVTFFIFFNALNRFSLQINSPFTLCVYLSALTTKIISFFQCLKRDDIKRR